MAWANSANIEGGVTLDLSSLKEIQLSPGTASVIVGSGARWGDIYARLDPLKLTVSGGRASQVGVGGLTLGGK